MNNKTCSIIVRILAVLLAGIFITNSQARTWTSTDGKSMQAIFLGIEGDNLRFKMRDGNEIVVPKDRFIKADQEAAERLDLIGDDSFTKASARQIDTLLAGNLKEAGFSSFNDPLPDDLFVRRVYLDIIGRIPTKEEFLTTRYHSPSELRLYADGYLHALRRSRALETREMARLESLVERWIMDPSSFIGPDGDVSTLYSHPHREW